MGRIIPATVALAALFLPGTSTAELRTLRLGDPEVDGSFIQPYTNRWKLVGKGADGSVIEMGVWIDKVGLDEIAGRKVIRRRQIWIHDKGAEGYYNVVDAKTLAPVLSQYTNAAGFYYRVEYDAADTTARYQRSPQPGNEPGPLKLDPAVPMRQGEIRTAAPYFDFNSGMFGLLVAGFPLTEGYAARFPVFRSFDPAEEPAWIDYRVERRETVPAGPGKTVEAWRVVVHSPATDETMIFDLTRDPPYIIRLQQAWMDRDWTFEMQ
jgi:hypothetical protein